MLIANVTHYFIAVSKTVVWKKVLLESASPWVVMVISRPTLRIMSNKRICHVKICLFVELDLPNVPRNNG